MNPVRQCEMSPAASSGQYISPLTADELARRNKELIELLDSWESDGDEQEQRETLTVLSQALGAQSGVRPDAIPMSLVVLLDAGPLSLVTNPKGSDQSHRCKAWLAELLAAGVQIMVPEGADYEVRRELIRAGRRGGLDRLDNLARKASFLPVTTAVWRALRNCGRRPETRALLRPMTRRSTAT